MFYKHWKKFALTLTALFWASCSETTDDAVLYGCPPDGCYDEPESSDANGDNSSSSEATGGESSSSSETAKPESSSIMNKLSSSDTDWSSSSFSAVYAPPTVFCYNDTAINDSGKVFDIFACENGQKYLRNPFQNYPDTPKDLPKDVNKNSLTPQMTKNCTAGPDICIDSYTMDENGNQIPTGGCFPTVECPDKDSVTCTPTDSSVSYFAEDYSADIKKMWKEEAAKHDAVDKIDTIKSTLAETPMCLENLRNELDRFVALYGAPTTIKNAVESCSDGTTRPSEEYAKFLKMQEEWEANKPALNEELKKVYEDKMKEIEARINKCLSGEADETDE